MLKFHTPKSKGNTIEQWRNDLRVRAVAVITFHAGRISGKQLAAHLQVSPRALRELLVHAGGFQVEYRSGEGRHDDAWYMIDPGLIQRPTELPKLVRAAQPVIPRLTTDHQSAVDRFMDKESVKKG